MSGIAVRSYEAAHLEACRALWRELTQHHRDIYENPGIGGADPGVHFDAYLDNPKRAATWVALDGGAVIGLTGLLVDGEEGEIEPVVVAAGHRGKGIGRRLVEHVIAQARERDLKSLSIRPVARNALAIESFSKAGFTLLGHLEMFLPLQPSKQEWRPGITLHGREFRI